MAKKKAARPRRTTWSGWLKRKKLNELVALHPAVAKQTWKPTANDRKAAWELYTEMRTRISTQPLHYRAGDEKAALDSLYKLFRCTRDLTREHGIECRHFATISVHVLNTKIRPFTARWHRRLIDGKLDTEDGRHLLRQELTKLQIQLREFQRFLGLLAEEDGFQAGSESGLEVTELCEFDDVGTPILYDRLLGLPDKISDEIIQSEQVDIAARRAMVNSNSEPLADLTGLAISGGGIRSATFAQGVLQGLVRTTLPEEYGTDDDGGPKRSDLLRDVDVLSTVSGGGYLGSFVSSFLNGAHANDEVGSRADQLPFRRREKCESDPLRYLRNNSRYLIAGGLFRKLTIVAQGLYGVVMNLAVLTVLVVLAVIATDWFPLADRLREASSHLTAGQSAFWEMSWGTWGFGGFWLSMTMLLPLIQKLGRISAAMHRLRSRFEMACIAGFGMMLFFLLIDSLPAAHYGFLWAARELAFCGRDGLEFTWHAVWPALGNVIAFLAARMAFVHAQKEKFKEGSRTLASLIRPAIGLLLGLAGPMLIIGLYFLLCQVFLVTHKGHMGWLHGGYVAAATIYALGLVNVNFISPHRYYRNRLVETYLLRHDPEARYKVKRDGRQLLSELGRSRKAPYHLINGSLNLPTGDSPELRGRDSDFFLFSRHFCGSPIMGYRPTIEWERYDGHLDLGTAMAISGAAASPHMGTTTPRGSSFLLTVLNIRLGYWLRRPNAVTWLPTWLVRSVGGPGPSYLVREMFGQLRLTYRFLGWKIPYVNVSDGGHIENLGVYELLRRRCKFIIAIDGECDPKLEFPSLMTLIEFAWIDFGVQIDIDLAELKLNEDRFSRTHFTLGRIEYPDGQQGLLLYIKLSVTGNEDAYVLDYRRANESFPHESTLDQVFEESQFEAYRALGEHVAGDLLRDELLTRRNHTPVPDADGRTLTVRSWFQHMADNLFEH